MPPRFTRWMVLCATLATLSSLQAQVFVDPYTATVGPAFGYEAQGRPAGFVSITGNPGALYYPFGGGLAQPEDDGYVSLNLPFNVYFFNQIIPAGNPLFVSANGYLLFGTSSTTVVPVNLQTEPASFGNQAAIAPIFTDLVARGQQAGGPGLYVETTGDAGSRQMNIEWSAMQHFNNGLTSKAISFQVMLFEESSRLLFNYDSTLFGNDADQGKMATVGIRDTTFSDPPDNVLQWGFQAGGASGTGIGLGGSNFQIEFNGIAAVPEPASIVLCAMGGAGLAASYWLRRRKCKTRMPKRK